MQTWHLVLRRCPRLRAVLYSHARTLCKDELSSIINCRSRNVFREPARADWLLPLLRQQILNALVLWQASKRALAMHLEKKVDVTGSLSNVSERALRSHSSSSYIHTRLTSSRMLLLAYVQDSCKSLDSRRNRGRRTSQRKEFAFPKLNGLKTLKAFTDNRQACATCPIARKSPPVLYGATPNIPVS